MDKVTKLVEENPHLEISKDDSGKEKVRCKLTGHELPCRLADIINYTKGKKYQRILKGLATHDKAGKDDQGTSLEEYKQYLVPAEKNRNQLYCKVTKKLINNIPYHIELHVKGKRFQRALKKYEETGNIDGTASGEGELDIWVPPEEPSFEPKIDTLPDSFGEDSNDDEVEMDQETVKDENDDEVNEKDKKKESNSNNTNKQIKKKLQGSKSRDKKNKQSNTRKRSRPEQPNKQKEITKKIKKTSKSKVSLGKKPQSKKPKM